MSLISALNIGKSALTAHQAAIATTGNNISNAGNADYTRQVTSLVPGKDQMLRSGVFLGSGVQVDSIRRQIDEALEGRLRGALSDSASAQVSQQWLGQIETVLNELSDADLSSQLSTFFTSWSNLANKPQDVGLRQVVVQNGAAVADWLNDVRGQFATLRQTIDNRLPEVVRAADAAAGRIAKLNEQIAAAEGGGTGMANGLRDQRDAVLKELSGYLDVTTVEQRNGSLYVYVGSEPLVMDAMNRGLKLETTTGPGGEPVTEVRFAENNGTVTLKGGQIGGLLDSRKAVAGATADVDAIASGLIFELNKIHSAGQGLEGFAEVKSTNFVEDPAAALNTEDAGLPHTPANGSFVVHVKDKATGLVTSTLIQVDLDGRNADDTTLNDLAAALDGVAGVNSGVNAGQLTVSADNAAVELSFSQDSSGVLASLGIGSFFTGKNALDISVNQSIKDNPRLLAAAKNGSPGDNQTARAIADLEGKTLAGLGGQSLKERYQAMTGGIATAAASARTNAEASRGVLETLEAQRQSLSGVSLDEEAVNLIREQRAFQGAARLIAAVDEMMDVVLNMVR